MPQPQRWLGNHRFYPIGNTPATSLTQDLLPGQPADILLLGCGDPRNILFTIFSDLLIGQEARTYDITCCDIEPAVLARNILLFSLLDRNVDLDRVWDIFYHLKIDDQALRIITHESQTLYDYSRNIESWRESPCGSYIKMVDTSTLAELSHYWDKYATYEGLTNEQKAKFLDQQTRSSAKLAGILQDEIVQSPSRSAGMLWPQARDLLTQLFLKYWETGTTFNLESEIQDAVNVNPTFLYSMSAEEFLPIEGTFPQGFHLISAFAPLKHNPIGPAPNAGSPIDVSKQQFAAWCESFRAARKTQSLTIRFFSGDAIAFCRALELFKSTGNSSTGIFVTNYRAAQIQFDESTTLPTSFDVIDTSNLTDNIGLLNLLIVAHSLLKEMPISQAVLYTESLLPFSEDPTKSFPERIFTDIPTIAMLLGLAPRAHVSNFTTQSNIHEILFSDHEEEYYERTAWCSPAYCDKDTLEKRIVPSFEADALACILFKIYDQMFVNERRSNLELPAPPSPSVLQRLIVAQHTRESIALLFRAVQKRVYLSEGTWEKVFLKFVDMCLKDKERIREPLNLQDLRLQAHLHGIHTSDTLTEGWFNNPQLRTSPRLGLFDDWETIPPVVCVVLTVPRKSLDAISQDLDHIGSPSFQCSVRGNGPKCYNLYSTIQFMWGKCLHSSTVNRLVVDEDSTGVRGRSDLIVSFWASSRLLEFPGTRISLVLRETLATMRLSLKLGRFLEVFGAGVTDKSCIRVLTYRPTLASEQPHSPSSTYSPPTFALSSEYLCRAMVSGSPTYHVDTLSVRFDIHSKQEQDDLLNGATVSASQRSACAVELAIGNFTHTIRYPYPVRGQSNKLRIARKSHYIEILVPVSKPEDQVSYYSNLFPILHNSRGAYTTWNVHHLHMDRLPTLSIEDPAQIDWLGTLLNLQLTEQERTLRDAPNTEIQGSVSPLVELKGLITNMVALYSGIRHPQANTFCLANESGSQIHTFILIGGIKLDLASSTIALDTAVVNVSSARLAVLMDRSKRLRDAGKHVQLDMTEHEASVWKKALPAFVERCRTWHHLEDCEYHAQGRIPLSTESNESPICTCGEGIGFSSPQWYIPEWKQLLPFATRAAICPIFLLSYIWRVATNFRDIPIDVDKICWNCGGSGKPSLLACSRCKKARYCSGECQRQNWKKHKVSCQAQ